MLQSNIADKQEPLINEEVVIRGDPTLQQEEAIKQVAAVYHEADAQQEVTIQQVADLHHKDPDTEAKVKILNTFYVLLSIGIKFGVSFVYFEYGLHHFFEISIAINLFLMSVDAAIDRCVFIKALNPLNPDGSEPEQLTFYDKLLRSLYWLNLVIFNITWIIASICFLVEVFYVRREYILYNSAKSFVAIYSTILAVVNVYFFALDARMTEFQGLVYVPKAIASPFLELFNKLPILNKKDA